MGDVVGSRGLRWWLRKCPSLVAVVRYLFGGSDGGWVSAAEKVECLPASSKKLSSADEEKTQLQSHESVSAVDAGGRC